MKIVQSKSGASYLVPFLLVTSLFFLWGFAHSILDVLNKHFQEALVITKARSGMVQAMVYGGYFLMALPAGFFIRKFGYKRGVVFGLLLYAIGAFLFIPGSRIMSFNFFLFSLFIIGCGLTFLETAANPYVTVLGDEKYSASRINFAQSFNGLGWILGPLVGGLILFSEDGDISLPYLIIGIAVVIVAIVFLRTPLPEIQQKVVADEKSEHRSVWGHSIFVFGVIALFLYVAAQTGINSFFINYVTETQPQIDNRTASLILSFGGMGLFMVGRFTGSWAMNRISPATYLTLFGIGAFASMLAVVTLNGWVAIAALVICYLFESIMFPTIFALAIHGLNDAQTKQASSFLIMSIVGGAIAPVLMGWMGENNMAIGFLVPLFCFMIIVSYGLFVRKKLNAN